MNLACEPASVVVDDEELQGFISDVNAGGLGIEHDFHGRPPGVLSQTYSIAGSTTSQQIVTEIHTKCAEIQHDVLESNRKEKFH